MQESSAAGYQLRKHYQKYLLKMECLETGANPQKLVEFADSQKKKKKEKESTLSGSSSVGQQGQDRTTGTTSLGNVFKYTKKTSTQEVLSMSKKLGKELRSENNCYALNYHLNWFVTFPIIILVAMVVAFTS